MIRRMVTHLVQCTSNGVIESVEDGNEFVNQQNVIHQQSIRSLCTIETRSKSSLTWNAILKNFMTYSSQFSTYREEFITIPRPLIDIKWHRIHNRTVLAPLILKQNAANIIAGNFDMNRKRKSEITVWTPPSKRIKLSSHEEDKQVKACSVVIRKISAKALLLQYDCVRKTSTVKLFNVLKEIPQEKEIEKPVVQNDFMNFLGLRHKETSNPKVIFDLKMNHPIKLASHTSIPFSSDYGRKLLAREHHFLSQDVALRKIERMEWYLKYASVIKNNLKPEITQSKRIKHFHYYKFPKKQFYSNHQSLKQAFLDYIIKPSYVKLQRVDLIEMKNTLYKQNLKLPEVSADCKENDTNLLPDSISTVNVNAVVTISSEAIGIGDSVSVVCPQNDLEYVSNSNELDSKLVSDSESKDGNHSHVRRSLRFCHIKA